MKHKRKHIAYINPGTECSECSRIKMLATERADVSTSMWQCPTYTMFTTTETNGQNQVTLYGLPMIRYCIVLVTVSLLSRILWHKSHFYLCSIASCEQNCLLTHMCWNLLRQVKVEPPTQGCLARQRQRVDPEVTGCHLQPLREAKLPYWPFTAPANWDHGSAHGSSWTLPVLTTQHCSTVGSHLYKK